jgi:hypothetical protein
MPGNFGSGIAAGRDLLDGFDLELFGVTFAAHGALLKSDFFIPQECLQNQGRFIDLSEKPPIRRSRAFDV